MYWRKIRSLALLTMLAVSTSSGAAQIWDGEAGDDNWTSSMNWVGDLAPVNGFVADVTVGDPAPTLLNTNAGLNSLTVDVNGILTVGSGLNLDFFGGVAPTTLNNSGSIIVSNNSDLQFSKTVVNTGMVDLNSLGNLTDIEVPADGANLMGGGIINLQGDFNSRIMGLSNSTLTISDQTIQGRGQIGANSISVDNQGNLIHANSPGNELRIDMDANGMMNTGFLQASNGGILSFNPGAIENAGGTIQALAGSEVRFLNGASIIGGTVATAGDGIARVMSGTNVFFEDVSNTSNLVVENNSDFGITGSLSNSGSVEINSLGNLTDIEIQAGGATINGGGTTTLTGSFNARIMGVSDALLIIEDQMIEGFGQLGADTISIDNQGNVIDANSNGNELRINANADGMTNTGILQASNGGVLGFEPGDIDNSGGVIQAQAGSEVQFRNGSRIINGTLSTDADGMLVVLPNISAFFEDITNSGSLVVENNSDMGVSGTITNTGNVWVASLGNITDIEVQSGGASIDGGGTITLDGSINARIAGVGNDLLTIVDQTIEGRGQVGANIIGIDNQGNLINANSAGNDLRIDPNVDGMTNTGILQASNGGILAFEAGTVNNTGGTIQALAGSEVQFRNGSTIIGGIVTSANDGVLRVNSSINAFFEDVTNNGNMIVGNNTDMGVTGTFTNNGDLSLDSVGNLTDFEVQASGATLTGNGTTRLAHPASRLDGPGDLEMNQGTLNGVGQINVNTTFRQDATLAPGNSIGELNVEGNHTVQFVDGGSIEIEVGATTGTAGVDWDLLDVNGTIDFDDDVLPSGAIIKIVSLDTNGDPGDLDGFNQGTDYSWVIADCNTIEGFDSSFVTVDTSSFANEFCGLFTVTQSGNQLVLNYVSQAIEVNPDGVTTIRGIVVNGDETDTFASDNLYLQYNPGFTLSSAEPPIWVEFEGEVTSGMPEWLNVKMEAQVNTTGIIHQVEMFNWNTNSYEVVEIRDTSFNVDRIDNIAIPVPADYIQAGTGAVKARLGWKKDGFIFIFPWTVSIDYVVWLLN